MGRFVNQNGVVFSVDDDKDERYSEAGGYDVAPAEKPATKRAASKPSTDSK